MWASVVVVSEITTSRIAAWFTGRTLFSPALDAVSDPHGPPFVAGFAGDRPRFDVASRVVVRRGQGLYYRESGRSQQAASFFRLSGRRRHPDPIHGRVSRSISRAARLIW